MAASSATSLADLSTVVVHVPASCIVPLPGNALWATFTSEPKFHEGFHVPELCNDFEAASYMGVVATAQPRQFLAEENLLVVSVVLGGQCYVTMHSQETPVPGQAIRVGSVCLGTVLTPIRKLGTESGDQWVVLAAVAPAGRTRLQRAPG